MAIAMKMRNTPTSQNRYCRARYKDKVGETLTGGRYPVQLHPIEGRGAGCLYPDPMRPCKFAGKNAG